MKLKPRFTIISTISVILFITRTFWLPILIRTKLLRRFLSTDTRHHQRLTSNIQPHAGHIRGDKIDLGYNGHDAASLSQSLSSSLAKDPLDKDFMPAQDAEKFDHVEHVRRWEDHLDDLSKSAREQADKRAGISRGRL